MGWSPCSQHGSQTRSLLVFSTMGRATGCGRYLQYLCLEEFNSPTIHHNRWCCAMITFTAKQYRLFQSHTLREIGLDFQGNLILKCDECDRVMIFGYGQKPRAIVVGELVRIDFGMSILDVPYPHRFSMGGLSITSAEAKKQ
jgi:hypothetical protein